MHRQLRVRWCFSGPLAPRPIGPTLAQSAAFAGSAGLCLLLSVSHILKHLDHVLAVGLECFSPFGSQAEERAGDLAHELLLDVYVTYALQPAHMRGQIPPRQSGLPHQVKKVRAINDV